MNEVEQKSFGYADLKNGVAVPRMIAIPAILIGVLLAILVTLPTRDAVIVCLVRGPIAYFHEGVRIRWSRPNSHFTTGDAVPGWAEGGVTMAMLLLPGYVGGLVSYGICRAFRKGKA